MMSVKSKSKFVYLVCGQVFANIFEENKQISVLEINDFLLLLSQFADDTNLFLDGSPETISAVTNSLTMAEQHLGLRVNYDKTTLYKLGNLQTADARYITQKIHVWKNPPIQSLGITVGGDDDMILQNLRLVINKAESILNTWKSFNLTLMGRVLVVNTLVESLFVYRLSVLPAMDTTLLTQIQDRIWKFVWKDCKARICFNALRLPKDQGGLRLTDLCTKHTALLIQWIFVMQKDPFLEKEMYSNIPMGLGELIWKATLNSKDVMLLCDE